MLGNKKLYSQGGQGDLENWEHSHLPSKEKEEKGEKHLQQPITGQ